MQWQWQVESTRPRGTRWRRVALVACLTAVMALRIAVVAVLLLPPQADLHPPRSADELTGRYDGAYHEELDPHPQHAASSESRIWVDSNSSARYVSIDASTYPTAAQAALAYRYWSPMRSSWIRPWYEPVSKPYRSSAVRTATGTQVRGLHCVADKYPLCQTWVFWQIEGRTVQETEITGLDMSYDAAIAEFTWVGKY